MPTRPPPPAPASPGWAGEGGPRSPIPQLRSPQGTDTGPQLCPCRMLRYPVAAEPGEKTSSRGQPVGIPLLEQEPEEPLGLGQLPTELLEMVLSHVPPHVLLGRCRRVCRRWRDLVDCQALWLSILARKHAALWPIVSTCLPAADDPRPCVLGRFCERRPIGRNLLRNPRGEGGEPRKGVLLKGAGGRGRMRGALGLRGWFQKKEVLDLEEEGFWPELLDSGKIEICVSARHWLELKGRGSHVFSNLKKGVRFVSFEQWVSNLEFGNEQYGVLFTNSSVIVRVCLS
ncbi:F-box only protein 27-like [Lagenorhynchus albirostris]|uniref:F-box only protein 27-like n=1 Tax=Lagenorhynchus albirostris TaxID=27610 RepID=UPI0028E4DC3F|nr:F-box only protein 27-like [Lagenorhynchus albirostris]